MIARHGGACALAVAAALAAPAAAGAAAVSVDKACYASGDAVAVTGSGFTPGAAVALTGAATGSAPTDAGGAFALAVVAPAVHGARPTTVALDAADRVAPALTATVMFPVVRAHFWTNAPIDGDPSARVTWRFAGFDPGMGIYGHLRYHGRTVATLRFGTAAGPCGVLTAHATRVPVKRLRAGRWQLKLDQSARYRAATPGRLIIFSIHDG